MSQSSSVGGGLSPSQDADARAWVKRRLRTAQQEGRTDPEWERGGTVKVDWYKTKVFGPFAYRMYVPGHPLEWSCVG